MEEEINKAIIIQKWWRRLYILKKVVIDSRKCFEEYSNVFGDDLPKWNSTFLSMPKYEICKEYEILSLQNRILQRISILKYENSIKKV